MIYNSSLTSKGQVTVPATIRRRLGLKPGEPVRFRITEANQVIIEKNSWQEDLTKLHAEVASHLKGRQKLPQSPLELDRAIDEQASRAVLKEWQEGQSNG